MNTKITIGAAKVAKERVFDTCGFTLSNLIIEKESTEYEACQFDLNNKKVLFRSAKITPAKTGLFVTVWKRTDNGPIAPFDNSDAIDLFVIDTRKGNYSGQFIFPTEVLAQKGIVTTGTKEGKRAFRVYPPWDKDLNKQAQKTQQWQLDYFLEIPLNKSINIERAGKLYF